MPQILSFIGYHNVGKTTLITKVAKELQERGYRIGIIKSTKHNICQEHKKGSDTWLFNEIGIKDISLVCPEGTLHFRPKSKKELNLSHMAFSMFSDVDLLLCEGFKNVSDLKKIEIARKDISKELLKDKVDGVMAVVADFMVNGIKTFSFHEISELCDFIIENYKLTSKNRQGFDIELFVNKRRIPLKRFVKDSLKNTVLGYISALKFTKDAEEIELKIRLDK